MTSAHLAFLILALPLGTAALIALALRRRGGLAAALSVAAAVVVAVGAFWLALSGTRFEIPGKWLTCSAI